MINPLGSNASVAELQLGGVRPEDIDGKTIVINVKLPKPSEFRISVLRREDSVRKERARIRQQEFMASYRDQFD